MRINLGLVCIENALSKADPRALVNGGDWYFHVSSPSTYLHMSSFSPVVR